MHSSLSPEQNNPHNTTGGTITATGNYYSALASDSSANTAVDPGDNMETQTNDGTMVSPGGGEAINSEAPMGESNISANQVTMASPESYSEGAYLPTTISGISSSTPSSNREKHGSLNCPRLICWLH